MTRVPTARSVAADVVVRVLKDKAFAAAALDAELSRNIQLDVRDRALATELVYGTLRLLGWLDKRIAKHAPKAVEVHVRAHLVVAAYQVLVLTRVPAFAAVDEAVSTVRALRGPRVAGFVNAVLRKIAAEPKPTPEELAQASLDMLDPALRRSLIAAVGREGALALVTPDEPALGLRVENESERDLWIARLREARPDARVEAGRVSPRAIVVRGAGRLQELPGYGEGAWTSQEEGSQAIALALGAEPGDVVLDACAGRGNKTGLLARAGATVDATDLHPSKLERLREELARIGLSVRNTVAVDWSLGNGGLTGPYDRVLVDAPCSGTGTMRRRPELLLRRKGADLEGLATLQKQILARTSALVRPGGRLIYAVCSVLREEAEEVVAEAAALGLTPDREPYRLLPHVHGTDGYFVASFVRT